MWRVCQTHGLASTEKFNLGCFYVTSIVYKNHRVTKMDSNDHPIFLGPVVLHKEANFQKYHYFLSHVQGKLSIQIDNVDILLPPSIQIRSDDEKGLTKAIDTVFPHAKRSLCTKHLKDNVSHYLRNNVGVNCKDRADILDKIFGENGILNATDVYQYEARSAHLLT